MKPDGTKGEVVEIEYESAVKYLEPVSPYASNDTAAPSSAEVQTKIDALVASLPKLKGGARSKADHQVRLLQRELRKALDIEEAARRHAERQSERKTQQGGVNVSPSGLEALDAATAKLVRATASLTVPTPNTTKKTTTPAFDLWLADFDRQQAKQKLERVLRDGGEVRAETKAAPTEKGAKNTCCQGNYLCPRCQAAAA